MKKTTKRSRKLEEFLYSKFQGNEANKLRYKHGGDSKAAVHNIPAAEGSSGLRTQRWGLLSVQRTPGWQLVLTIGFRIRIHSNLLA